MIMSTLVLDIGTCSGNGITTVLNIAFATAIESGLRLIMTHITLL